SNAGSLRLRTRSCTTSMLHRRAHLCVFRFASLALGLSLFASCSAQQTPPHEAAPRRPMYRPGQSLDAHMCHCQECAEAACCSGEPSEPEASSAPEPTTSGDEPVTLGMDMRVCSRCVRRVWVARGSDECANNAPASCCGGTIGG